MASPRVFSVVATVPTGLERGAADEFREILQREAKVQRGSITCTLETVDELTMFNQLRSIDKYYTVVKILPHFCREESTVLDRLQSLPFDGQLDWTASLLLWQYYSDNIEQTLSHATPEEKAPDRDTPLSDKDADSSLGRGAGDLAPSVEPSSGGSTNPTKGDHTSTSVESPEACSTVGIVSSLENGDRQSNPTNDGHTLQAAESSEFAGSSGVSERERPYGALLKRRDLTFRATCTRGGRKHCFTSQDAAKYFGAGLAQYFGWKVQLKQPDIEVLLTISGDSAQVGVALTREAKFKRNITYFGPTTLRATIAYGMLRCAEIQPGDIILDPLCGGGTINIEGSLAWPDTYHLAGDLHHLAVPRTAANISSLLDQREHRGDVKVDVCQWDVCRLPVRTATVDVVVTDMPFGKKSGSRLANWELYPKALSEMARVCRPQTARAVLLTHDNKALSKSVQRDVFWKRVKTLWVNVGGLEVALYILQRSSVPFRP